MDVLDTFTILFKGDTDALKRGRKDAKKTTDDLQASIEKTDKTTAQLGSSFANVAAQLGTAAVSFLSVNALLSNTQKSIAYADQIGLFSRTVGLSTETVSAWGNAVESAGGRSEAFQSIISSLNGQLLELALTGNSALLPVLSQLGIAAVDASGRVKTGFQLLRDIGARLQSMPEPTAFALGQRLGIDPALISILRSGAHEIDALLSRQQKLGVVTEKQAEIVRQLRAQWSDLTHAWRQNGVDTVERLSGVLSTLMSGLTNFVIFLREHENLVTGFFIALAGVTAIAALGVLALAAPFLLLAAAMALFALAYDDIKTYLAGGDSIIGRAIERWPLLGDAINFVSDALSKFFSLLESGWEKTKNISSFLQFFIRRKFGGKSDDTLEDALAIANDSLRAADVNPLTSISNTTLLEKNLGAATRQFNISIDRIDVNTQATDVSDIANNIADELRRQTENAVDNFDDGLLA